MLLRSSRSDGFRRRYRNSEEEDPLSAPMVDAEGYTTNLRELVDVLETSNGLRMYESAYIENMKYKVDRYTELLSEAREEVDRQQALVKLRVPELKRISNADDSYNWPIFETVSKAYLESMERASAFDAIRQRASNRVKEAETEIPDAQDTMRKRRDELVLALRMLTNFSAQSHIVSAVTDVIGAFLKNPRLIRTKFLNFILAGPAGTGKTTLASYIAAAFAAAGMFVDDKVIHAGRAEFVGEYEGQTVARTRAFLVSTLDRGVVFIDEAYAITPWSNGKPEGYGSEAVSAMVEFMSRYKGLYCIVAAGYEKEMRRYFLPTNPGLTRRFPFRFVLERLMPSELIEVFKRTLLTEQGLSVPSGRASALESDDYFTEEGWNYLRHIIEYATEGDEAHIRDEFDQATRVTYPYVLTFKPRFPHLYSLFENQAGSMTNLAEEGVTVLFRCVTFREAVQVQRKQQQRPQVPHGQSVSVMREILCNRIRNSTLSDGPAFMDELRMVETCLRRGS